MEISSNPLVKYNGEATNILIEIRTTSESPSFVIPKSYPKPCQICGPAGREILDFNFYRNRSNSDTSPHPKTRDENDQKMSPNQWFCVMPYRSQSYMDTDFKCGFEVPGARLKCPVPVSEVPGFERFGCLVRKL